MAFKSLINQLVYRPNAALIAANAAGQSFAYDKRNDDSNFPYSFLLRSAVAVDAYDPTTDEFIALNSPALANTFGIGAAATQHPSLGPNSKVIAGSTSTVINLDSLGEGAVPANTWSRTTTVGTITTPTAHGFAIGQQVWVTITSDAAAIPLGLYTIVTVPTSTTYTITVLNAGAASGTLTIGRAVGANSMANRGDGRGRKVRIVGLGSGKIEEKRIISNTGGATPSIVLDSALSFTPQVGDIVEFISGRVYLLNAGAPTAGQFKFLDLVTGLYSGNLAVTNLPTLNSDSQLIPLSELHVPHNRKPGEGFVSGGGTADGKQCIVATAATSTTITGSGMPADLLTNEYRNFQVRIVEDTVTPTAVGQRRRIASHTSGATGVFTVAAFAVTPSSSAKFVVENDNDKIILLTNNTAVYTYNIAANTWDTTTFGAAAVAGGVGLVADQSFGIVRDGSGSGRHSHIYRIRGGGVAAIDVLDIAGGANGAWTADIIYTNRGQTFTTGNSGCYDPATRDGRFIHLNINGTQRFARFDVKNRILDPGTYFPIAQGVAVAGQRLFMNYNFTEPSDVGFLYFASSSTLNMYSIPILI